MNSIPTFVINLKKRVDRKEHALNQFENKKEFNISIVEAIEHETGSIGLWETIKLILKESLQAAHEYIIICEDDHEFTEHYSKELLFKSINEALKYKTDMLTGGVSWFSNAFAVTENVLWIEGFTGFQFTIIFGHFYKRILAAEFDEHDAADFKVSSLTTNKFLIFPFISVQREFGYSDVTSANNTRGKVQMQFTCSLNKGDIVRTIYDFISKQNRAVPALAPNQYEDVIIPVYIAVHPNNRECASLTFSQFNGKDEFEIIVVESEQPAGNKGVSWKNIRKITELALESDEDLIVICEESHEFSKHYSKELFLKNVIEAYYQRVEVLYGGVDDFDIAIPVAENRCWINIFSSTGLLVLNRSLFKKILDHDAGDLSSADAILSGLTNNKMTIFPFISAQAEREHALPQKKEHERKISGSPIPAEERIKVALHMHKRYYSKP